MTAFHVALRAGAVTVAASLLAYSNARADVPVRQVNIEARIVEVSGEFAAGLGVAFDSVHGRYTSTSNEEPGSGDGSSVNGAGSAGFNLWFNTGLLKPDPGGRNALNLGLGAAFTGFFGGDNDVLSLVRHNNNDIPDVTVKRNIDHALDITARASIPILVRPRLLATEGKPARIIVEPFIGLSVIETQTTIRSDRTVLLGPLLSESHSEVKTGLVTGVGVLTDLGKIPFLGDIPVLGGLFYTGRRVPGGDAVVSGGGVSETGRTGASWQHQGLIVLITPFVIRDTGK